MGDPVLRPPENLSELQKSDSTLGDMFMYLLKGILPAEDKAACKVILESRHFDLLDGVLYHENPHTPGRWCLVVPSDLRVSLLEDAHSGY